MLFEVPVDVCWCLLMHVDVCRHFLCLVLSVDVTSCVRGVCGGIWALFSNYKTLGCVWGKFECSALEEWKQNTILAQLWMRRFFNLQSLKYKNIKMSRYQLSKNHLVMLIKNKTIVIVWLKISLLYQINFSTIWRGIPLEIWVFSDQVAIKLPLMLIEPQKVHNGGELSSGPG